MEPIRRKIVACCGAGHRQSIVVEVCSEEFAETMAGLLDGTSTLYKVPPDDDSPIGKCGICGKSVRCTVEGDSP